MWFVRDLYVRDLYGIPGFFLLWTSLGLEALAMLLGGISYAPIFHRRMGPACVYICEEEYRYFDCEMAPPVEGKSIGRSIDCKHPVVLHCNIIVSKYIASVSGSSIAAAVEPSSWPWKRPQIALLSLPIGPERICYSRNLCLLPSGGQRHAVRSGITIIRVPSWHIEYLCIDPCIYPCINPLELWIRSRFTYSVLLDFHQINSLVVLHKPQKLLATEYNWIDGYCADCADSSSATRINRSIRRLKHSSCAQFLWIDTRIDTQILDVPGGHSDDGYTASNGVSWPPEGRGHKFRLQQILSGPRVRDRRLSVICFQGQEGDSAVAAMDHVGIHAGERT